MESLEAVYWATVALTDQVPPRCRKVLSFNRRFFGDDRRENCREIRVLETLGTVENSGSRCVYDPAGEHEVGLPRVAGPEVEPNNGYILS